MPFVFNALYTIAHPVATFTTRAGYDTWRTSGKTNARSPKENSASGI